VRELQNCIERAMILCEGDEIGVEQLHLPEPQAAAQTMAVGSGSADLSCSLAEVAQAAARAAERGHIVRALQMAGGDRSRAAGILGISPRTLVNKIRDLGVVVE
jgi:DNA-binding NtrC family response regulator